MPEPNKPDFSWWQAIKMIVAALMTIAAGIYYLSYINSTWIVVALIVITIVTIAIVVATKNDTLSLARNLVMALAYVAFIGSLLGWAYYGNLPGGLWTVAALICIPVAVGGIVLLSGWVVEQLFPDRDPPVEALLSRSAEQRDAEPVVFLERPANRALVVFVGATGTLIIGIASWAKLRTGGDIVGWLMVSVTVVWFVGLVVSPLFIRRRISFGAGAMTYAARGPLRSRSHTVALADVKSVKYSKYYTEVRTHGNQRIWIPEVAFAPKDIGITLYLLLGKRDYLSRSVINPVALSLFLAAAALWAAAIGFLVYSILYMDGWNRMAVMWAGN